MNVRLNLDTETVDQCELDAPLCLSRQTTVADALGQMKEANSATVLICKDEKVLGIFTERDALKLLATGASFDVPLEECMTPDPVILHAQDKVGKAIHLMVEGGYRRLPIVDDNGKPAGVIKMEAIMHYLVEHFPTVIHTLPPEPHQTTESREGA